MVSDYRLYPDNPVTGDPSPTVERLSDGASVPIGAAGNAASAAYDAWLAAGNAPLAAGAADPGAGES